MKKIIITNVLIVLSSILLVGCGISTDVRTASTRFVAKQKASLEVHESFHATIIETLNMFLGAEISNSEKEYNIAVENYHKALLEELIAINKNTGYSVEKRIEEEENVRNTIMGYILKAESNRKKREELITKAQQSLVDASNSLIKGEKAKTLAVEKLDQYLQEERPSERLLDLVNIDLDNYSGYIENANSAIQHAKTFIDKL